MFPAFSSIVCRCFRRGLRLSGVGALSLACAGLLGAQATHRGRKYTPPPDTSRIEITVTRETNGKPIQGAAVVFQALKDGKDRQGSMELKTDDEGKTSLDVIPMGDTVRLQVIAKGFQTFGNDYVIDTKAKAISIKLKRPQEQYSLYKGNATGDQSGQATTRDAGQMRPEGQDGGAGANGQSSAAGAPDGSSQSKPPAGQPTPPAGQPAPSAAAQPDAVKPGQLEAGAPQQQGGGGQQPDSAGSPSPGSGQAAQPDAAKPQ